MAGSIGVGPGGRRFDPGPGFFGLRLGSRRVHAWLLGLSEYTLGVVGLIRGSWVNWGAPCGSMGSSRVAEFIGVRSGGRRVHPVSQGSLRCALEVVVFFQSHWIHSGTSW